MKTLQKCTLALVTALGLGLASSAAVSGPCGDGGPRYGHGKGYRHGGTEEQRAFRQQRHAEQMELLKSRLNLQSEEQEVAWQAFVDAQNVHHETMGGWKRKQGPDTTVPEQFSGRIEFMEQRLASLKTMAQAADELYASLSPEQKTIMDDFVATRPGRRGRWGYSTD